MHPLPFIRDLVIILAAAVVIIFVSRPLKLPGVIGFLLTGMLIGPSGLNFIADKEQVEVFAELGVVMLLFFIGLEFSLAQLKAIWRQFFVSGSLQVLGTIAVVFLLFSVGDFNPNEKIFFGCLVALSSTAIVLKMLADRSELEAPHGKLSIGILLFQDFCIVPMIVFTPLLAGSIGASVSGIVLRFLMSIVVVAAVFYIARFVMPKVLHQIAQTHVREAFLMGSLLVCLVMAGMTASLGFSYALGAFIAGLIISESEYSHQVVAEIISFRDFFASLFFISVGMLLDLNFVIGKPFAVLGIGLGILLLKASIIFAIVRWMNFSFRTAVITALSLSQIGEFSFVLAEVGQAANLLDENVYQHFLSASIVTMLVSPPLIMAAPVIATHTHTLLPSLARRQDAKSASTKSMIDHVIIVGFGVNGENLARVLKETGIPYLVLETDGNVVRRLKREGHPVAFGDAARTDILSLCSVEQARLIVFAISDPYATRTAVRLTRLINPHIYIVVRTRLVAEVDELVKLGADEVIPEEFETSIEIFTRVLDQYHIPRNVVNAQIKVIRDENYSMLRGLPQSARGLDRVSQLLAAGTSDTYLVTDDCIAVGKTLRELELPAKTGAILLAVVRGEKPFVTPDADFRIEASDTLVLVGSHANMDKAFDYLSQPAEEHKG